MCLPKLRRWCVATHLTEDWIPAFAGMTIAKRRSGLLAIFIDTRVTDLG